MVQIVFNIPYALVLPNRRGIASTRFSGAGKIRREREQMAWEIAAELAGFRPAAPLKYARVQVFRHSTGVPDTDNLYASCKPLLDVLQPATDRRLYGLGVIQNDSPTRCELRAFDEPLRKGLKAFTRVIITEMDAETIAAARRRARSTDDIKSSQPSCHGVEV